VNDVSQRVTAGAVAIAMERKNNLKRVYLKEDKEIAQLIRLCTYKQFQSLLFREREVFPRYG
jgi:hypothetical protein